jgi:hypothetical protein
MITVWAWEQLSDGQQTAAQAQCGLPPSGPEGVLWAYDSDAREWRWKSAVWPDDVRRGVKIGQQGGAR